MVKYLISIFLAAPMLIGQTGTATIHGTIIDGKTQNPIPAALVIASRAGAPAFIRNSKSGGDGAFQIQGLTPGNYSLCVQTVDESPAAPAPPPWSSRTSRSRFRRQAQ